MFGKGICTDCLTSVGPVFVLETAPRGTSTNEVTSAESSRLVTFEPDLVTELEQDVQEISVPDFKMEMLGDNVRGELSGPPIQEVVAEKWSPIFTNGLLKEVKDSLLRKYPAPENLPLCRAPKLNIEVRNVVPLASAKRDDYQRSTQTLLQSSISAQAMVMSELLKPEDKWDAKKVFELCSDAARISCLVQHHISRARRALITPMMSVSAKSALESSPIDNQLLGEQFLTKMKETSAPDKLVESLTVPSFSFSKPVQQQQQQRQQQTASRQQFKQKPLNSKNPVGKSHASRQTGKSDSQRRRSSSRSRHHHHRA